jgi:hypothetical protein
MTTKTAKAALGAALMAAALALTACTGGNTPAPSPSASETTKTQSPTATPTPTAVAAPASQEEALKQGLGAVNKYSSMLDELSQAKATDTKRLESVAKGPALTFATNFVAASAKSTTKFSGSVTDTLDSGYASELTVGTEKFEFGTVDMKVCEDSSNVIGVRPDGSPERKSDHPRVIVQYWAEYNPTSKSWLVSNIKQDGVVPC